MQCLVMPSPPLETAGTVVFVSSTDTIALSVVLAFGLSSFGLSSFGLSSSGFSSSELSSSEGAGTGLTSPVGTGTG